MSDKRVKSIRILPRLLMEPAMLVIDFEDGKCVKVELSAVPKDVASSLRIAAKEIALHLRKRSEPTGEQS